METVYKCECHGKEFKSMAECQEHEKKYIMLGSNLVGKIFVRLPVKYLNATIIYEILSVTEDKIFADKMFVRHDIDRTELSTWKNISFDKQHFKDIELMGCVEAEQVPSKVIMELRHKIREGNIGQADTFIAETFCKCKPSF